MWQSPCIKQLVRSQFPDQGSNPPLSSESAESQPLDHPGISCTLLLFELEDTLEKILACNPFIFYTRKLWLKELGVFWVSWEKNCDFFFQYIILELKSNEHLDQFNQLKNSTVAMFYLVKIKPKPTWIMNASF